MFLSESVSHLLRRRFMDEIKNPINLINKEYKTINLVTFEEWLEDSDKLSKLGIGVILDPSNDVGLIKESLDSIELIVLDFRNFDDGRGYSQAYFLSKRWKFKGEIVGINAHLDQLQFMIRSGITSYQLLESYKGFNEEDYSSGFSICYQAAANNSGLNLKY
jgi:uncharacterized protein (DUF934 family)